MRRSIIAVVTGLFLLLGVVAAPAEADGHRAGNPNVMTQNLYVGADLFRLFDPNVSPLDILATIQQTNFEERAATIARKIDNRNPDLIGLQEVSDLSVTFQTPTGQDGALECNRLEPGPPVPGLPNFDYLGILLDALSDVGEHYVVPSDGKTEAIATNAQVSLPFDVETPDGGTIPVCGNLVDRDVILARVDDDVSTSNPQSGNFAVNLTVPLPKPLPVVEFTRGWTTIEATVRGATFIFANTHLEVAPEEGGLCPPLPPPDGFPCQILQAQELVGKVLTDTSLPTILVGDFNAEPGTPAYNIIAGAGFADAWDIRLLGILQQENTCCQDEELMNKFSALSQRIDIIFIRVDGKAGSLSTVVFDRFWEKTPSGLWPSDHAGVIARLFYGDR